MGEENNVTMRAKMKVTTVKMYSQSEELEMMAVSGVPSYPADGSDENNTYAKFTPSASLKISIANPALFGKFRPDDVLYVDFISAPEENKI